MKEQNEMPQTTGKKSKYALKQEAMRRGTYTGNSPFYEDKETASPQEEQPGEAAEETPPADPQV